MKKILLACVAVAMVVASCTVQQTAVMDEIRKIDNIEFVRLPLSLINSLTGLGNKLDDVPGLNLSGLKNVNNIDVMTIKDSDAKSKARRLLNQFYKGNSYELILKSQRGRTQGLSVFALPAGGNRYSNVIIINDSAADITIVELRGSMSLADFSVLTNLLD